MKKAYIYTRVSTAIQVDGYSLEAQRARLIKEANHRGYKVIGEYSDEGKSGKNIVGRPDFQRMLEDIRSTNNRPDYVFVFKLSRFGRNAADTLNSLQFLEDFGVNLLCVEDGIDSGGAAGKLMISIYAAVAEAERENIKVQTMAGRKQKASKGEWNGGFAPYGYDLIDGSLVVREDEAVVIRELYRLYVETDFGANGVAARLNELYKKNARKTGKLQRFSAHFVKGAIKNPIYKGTVAFGRRHTAPVEGKRNEYHVIWQTDDSQIILSKGKHEALVSEELWDKANEKMQRLSVKKEKIDPKHEYILSGLVKCPDCGAPMYGIPNGKKKNKWGEEYRTSYSYKCRNQNRESGHICSSHTQYSASKLDNAVKDIIIDMINDENFKARIDELVGSHVDEDNIMELIESEKKEQRRLSGVISRIEAQLNDLDYDDPAAIGMEQSLNVRLKNALTSQGESMLRMQKLEERLMKASNERIARDSIYDYLEYFEEIYDHLEDKEKKMLMQAMISSIELYPKQQGKKGGQWIKAIHFTLPLSYHGKITQDIQRDEDSEIFQPKEKQVETVVLITKK